MEKVWNNRFRKFGGKFGGIFFFKNQFDKLGAKNKVDNCVEHLMDKFGEHFLWIKWQKSWVKNFV